MQVASPTELVWQKVPGIRRTRELLLEGQTWVRLRRMSVFRSLATVEAGTSSWTLKRVGWFRTRVTVRRAGETENIAVFTPNWLGSCGTLEFADGRAYRWATTKSFGREHTLSRADGTTVLRFRGGSRMRIETGERETDLPLLAAFGYYLLQLEREDSATVTAAAAG
jgi:hypothetical protein